MTAPAAADLRALSSAVADFLAAQGGEAAVRAAMDTNSYDATAWDQMCSQLGLAGLAVSEARGGSGGGIEEFGVVLEETGKALYPSPLLSTGLAAWALDQAAASAAVTHALAALIAGAKRATVAPTSAVRVVDGHLSGVAPYVLDAASVDVLVVAAGDGDEAGLYLVEAGTAGLSVAPRDVIDLTRPMADVSFDAVAAERLGGPDAVARLRAVAATALAAEQMGGAASALASAVDYAKIRTQFGQPIGSFQSIKHLCSDVLLAVESGRAAARHSARAIDTGDPQLEVFASVAAAWCTEAYVRAAETSLQIHGGIGFTWEHVAHLHLKRAKTDEFLFGDARHHRERLADLLGLKGSSS